MAPLPTNKYLLLLAIIIGHSLLGGYYAGTRPEGAGWRFFSWHPFLMMVGTSNVSLFLVLYIYSMHGIYYDAASMILRAQYIMSAQPEKKENE